MNDDKFFTMLAANTDATHGSGDRAPARLKSRLYSTLIAAQAASGPLLNLPATRAAGRPLCVFEHVYFESPPIYWPHCPYVEFRRR